MKRLKQTTHTAILSGLLTFSGALSCATVENVVHLDAGSYEAKSLVTAGSTSPNAPEANSPQDSDAGASTGESRPPKTFVALPAAAWLFGSAVIGLTVVARRRQ